MKGVGTIGLIALALAVAFIKWQIAWRHRHQPRVVIQPVTKVADSADVVGDWVQVPHV